VKPSRNDLLISPSSSAQGSAPTPTLGTEKVLLLLDPRAAVHATVGLLPTASLSIPPDQYADTLSSLEMTFQAAPILKPAPGLSLPLPNLGGYTFSFIEEEVQGAGSTWRVTPEIDSPAARAIWQYSPQSLTEGWLRVNPTVLRFSLTNASGAPVVDAPGPASLTLTVKNLRQVSVTFSPGTIVDEDSPKQGSLVYVHFGALVPQAAVPSIVLAAAGWTFTPLSDSVRGNYWAGTPNGAAVTLPPGGSFSVAISGLTIAEGLVQSKVYFDYYGVAPDSDGTDIALIAVQAANNAGARAGEVVHSP
jgi:hypothetical protein